MLSSVFLSRGRAPLTPDQKRPPPERRLPEDVLLPERRELDALLPADARELLGLRDDPPNPLGIRALALPAEEGPGLCADTSPCAYRSADSAYCCAD